MRGPKIQSLHLPGGTTKYYTSDGKYVGYSQEGLLGETQHFDHRGRNVGYSVPGILGGSTHYGSSGEIVGESVDTLTGTSYRGVDGTTGRSEIDLLGSDVFLSDDASPDFGCDSLFDDY